MGSRTSRDDFGSFRNLESIGVIRGLLPPFVWFVRFVDNPLPFLGGVVQS